MKKRSILTNHSGFTLVEVIVASVILFSAIAIGTLAYRTSVTAMDRITANARIAAALPEIMAEVKAQLKEKKESGGGSYDGAMTYAYTSNRLRTFGNLMNYRDMITGGLSYGRFRIALDDINLVIRIEDGACSGESRYAYKELTWFSADESGER